MLNAIFLDIDSVYPEDLDLTPISSQVSHLQLCNLHTADDLNQQLPDYQIVISNKVLLNRNILISNPQLKLICIAATGTNNVDLDAARELGIAVSNVRAYATQSVVQHVFALILNLTTRLEETQTAVRNGEWCHSPHFSLLAYPVEELAGKTMGIIGFGELGQAVAELAHAFGMEVLIAQRNRQDHRAGRIPLEQLLQQSDVVSLHCPLTAETENLIRADQLNLMKSSAILINTARGGIVNEADLIQALQNKQIGGAGFDVLTTEPPPADHPMLQFESPRLIITPHVAWAAKESRQRLINQIGQNIAAYNLGKVRNSVVSLA